MNTLTIVLAVIANNFLGHEHAYPPLGEGRNLLDIAIGTLNRLLKMAVLAGVETAVRLHVRRGDDLDATDDNGMTPLMLAASRNKATICSILLEAGVDLSLKDNSGRNALSIARLAGAAQAASVIEAAVVGREPQSAEEDNSRSPATIADGKSDNQSSHTVLADKPEPILFDDGDSLDLSGWEVEFDGPAPEGDDSLALAAATLHHAISAHRPVDTSEDWDDFEAFLPERAARLPKADDTEARERIRSLLLRGVRERSVPELLLMSICENNDGSRNEDGEQLVRLVLGELGVDTDDRIETDPAVYMGQESPEEEDLLSEALLFLDDIGSGANEPFRHYVKDMRRGRLLTAEEELALGREMEEAFDAALDALASWPEGVMSLLAATEGVRAGEIDFDSVSTGPDSPDGDSTPSLTLLSNDDSLDEELTQSEPVREFFHRIEKISALAAGAGLGGPAEHELRSALAHAGLARTFLLSLTENGKGSADGPSTAFRSAVLRHVAARERLALSNLRLVFSVAKRYQGMGLPLDDLVQEGNLGLLKAVDRYDWRKGFRFSTYATWWIRQQTSRALADKGRTIRVPVHINDTILRLAREVDLLERTSGRQPSVAELAVRFEISAEKVFSLMARREEPLPIHEINAEAIVDTQAIDAADIIASADLRRVIGRMLGELDPKTSEVLSLRFGVGQDDSLTLEETGARFGVTRERIRQIESKGLRILRHPSRSALLEEFHDHAHLKKTKLEELDDEAEEHAPANESAPVESPLVKAEEPCNRTYGEVAASRLPTGEHVAKIQLRINKGLDKLVSEAREIGLRVEDDRAGGGGVVIALVDHKDTKRRRLARMLIEKGFAYYPGMGYRK